MNDVLTAPPPVSAPVPAFPPPTRVAFVGHRPTFVRLVSRAAMLELFTLGFYRFWIATDMRRYLWSHTTIEGDAPEYTGTAKELLIGFLFAVAILLPINLAYILIGLEAERIQMFASIPLVLFFYFFAQFANYRARRYRLTRTVWRGVRLSMVGSGWNYAWRAGLWTLLAIVTLGLAWPWRQAALERFKMRHTAYGNLQGRFEGRAWDFFKEGWWLWLLMLVAAPFALLLVGMIAVPFIYAAYKSIEWRWWVSGLRFGDVRVQSELKRGDLIGTYWKTIGWIFFFSSAGGVWISSVLSGTASLLGGGKLTTESFALAAQHPVAIGLMVVGYIAAALACGAVMRVYLMHEVWQRISESTTVHNLAAAESVTAQGALAGALGEGFADSLDIGGF